MSEDDSLTDSLLEKFISTHLDSGCNYPSIADAEMPQTGPGHSKKPEKTLTLEELNAEKNQLLGQVALYNRRIEILKDVLAEQQSDISSSRKEHRRFMELKKEYDEVKAQIKAEEEKYKTLMRLVNHDDLKKKEVAYKAEITAKKKNIRRLKSENKSLDKKRLRELKQFFWSCEALLEKGPYEKRYLQWEKEYEQKTKK